ncbi:MAG: TIGR02996 domain-containing protein [Myxococcales bacterium]
MATLTTIEAMLEQGDPASALEAVCELWRDTRDTRLAILAEKLAERCAKLAKPLPAKPVAKHHELWLAQAPKATAAELAVLLPSLASHKAPMALERIEKLAGQRPNPLVALALTKLVLAPPFQSTGGKLFWKRLFATLPDHADPRTVELLEPCAGTFAERLGAATIGEVFESGVAAALPALKKELASLHRPLGGEDLTALARLEAASAAPASASKTDATGEDLLAQVLAHPEDDGPRQVLADRLQEKGDPRGELIALQFKRRAGGLEAKEEAREKALLNKHLGAWLGPLANVVLKKSVRFERGFLASCEYFAKKKVDADGALGVPLWATVEYLEGAVPAEVLTGSPMRALRRLDASPEKLQSSKSDAVVRLSTVAALARHEPFTHLEAIACWTGSDDAAAAQAVLAASEAPGLPALRELALHGYTRDSRWLWGSPLAKRLTRVTLPPLDYGGSWQPYSRKDDHDWGPTALAELLADLEAASCRIPEIRLRLVGTLVTFTFPKNGKPTAVLTLEKSRPPPYFGFTPHDGVAQSFAGIPAGRLARLEICPGKGFDHGPLAKAAAMLTEVVVRDR